MARCDQAQIALPAGGLAPILDHPGTTRASELERCATELEACRRGPRGKQKETGRAEGRKGEDCQDDGPTILPGDGRPEASLWQQSARIPRAMEEGGDERELLLLARLRRGQEVRASYSVSGKTGEGASALPVSGRTDELPGHGRQGRPTRLGKEWVSNQYDGGLQGQHQWHCSRG
jgi:hypothetical protein